MLPNNSTEGNPQAPAGGAEQPASPPSGAQGQPLPEYVTALQSQIADLTKQLGGLQKGTDKQIGQVRGDIKRILELKEQGMNESQIQRELYIDSLMSSQSAPAPTPAGTGTQSTGLDVEAVLKSLQFSDNDPALAAIKIKHSGNSQELLKAAADLRLQQLQSPNPSPASGLSPTGNPNAGTSQDQIDSQFSQLQELYKNYSANRLQIEQIEKNLEASGAIARR